MTRPALRSFPIAVNEHRKNGLTREARRASSMARPGYARCFPPAAPGTEVQVELVIPIRPIRGPLGRRCNERLALKYLKAIAVPRFCDDDQPPIRSENRRQVFRYRCSWLVLCNANPNVDGRILNLSDQSANAVLFTRGQNRGLIDICSLLRDDLFCRPAAIPAPIASDG